MKRKLRILVVKSYHKGDTVVWEEACKLREFGHHVEVLIPARSEVVSFLKDCNVSTNIVNIWSSLITKNFFKKRILDLKGIWKLRKLFKKFDVVHLNLQRARILGRLANILRDFPVVVSTIHGIDLEKWQMLILERLTVKLDACTVGISSDVLQYLHEKKITPRKKEVIHNGINLSEIDKIQHHPYFLHKLQNIPFDVSIIGMIARFYPGNIKGHETFIRAAYKIHLIHPDLRFAIIGGCPFDDCSFTQEMELLVKRLNMESYIHFIGELKHREIPKVLDSLKVLVVPSTIREGFGLVITEAMARSIPVIGSKIGGIPEVIEEGKTGLLVPPGDPEALAKAILQILSNAEMAKEMGKAGRRRVEKYFTVEIMARRYEALFYQLLSERTK